MTLEVSVDLGPCLDIIDKTVCPVCGKQISSKFLPDAQGFITENLYHIGNVRLVSKTTLECDFFHFFNEEEDITLEDPHSLTAIVVADFDCFGECTSFDIVDIVPKKKLRKKQEIIFFLLFFYLGDKYLWLIISSLLFSLAFLFSLLIILPRFFYLYY
jgi:hypothetical protein